MVKADNAGSAEEAVDIVVDEVKPGANKINAQTPYDFDGRSLTAYGGLLPAAALLEKLGFEELVHETVNLELRRQTRSMAPYQFLIGMILAVYVGFSRLNHLQYLEREPMILGILRVSRLPVQSTFWRFLESLHLTVAAQLGRLEARLRQRVWDAANVKLTEVTLDTDTTVHTLYGSQMGGRVSYNPKNKGKKSYQPMLTFVAETREFAGGGLRNGDKPSGEDIARHLRLVIEHLPKTVKKIRARADAGFYCWKAVEAYTEAGCEFVLVARKTPRLVEELQAATWKRSKDTDADFECEFAYRPEGWDKPFRFVGLRYDQREPDSRDPDQMGFFEGLACRFRVFVTNLDHWTIAEVTGFYDKRAAVENLIKESNNDAGLTAHPSGIWAMNANHFQLSMLAYNLNCWLALFQREQDAKVEDLTHRTMATTRLRMLYLAARIWRHGGRTGTSYGSHYQERGLFDTLMQRLRAIERTPNGYGPVVPIPLRA